MSMVKSLITDLREKRLWPVAVALVAALIAIPVLLTKSSSPAAVAQVPALPSLGAPSPALPAVSVTTTPSTTRLTGSGRNPFNQQVKPSTGTPSTTGGASTTSTGAKASTGSSGSTGTTTSSASGTAGSTTTTTTTPEATSTPAPTALTATQSYHVTISMTNSSGGLNLIDPVNRLSVLPSTQQPLLVELGVLQGGNHVLFVVQPGTVVRGPGTCTPGPIDCEILALAPNQTESVARQSSPNAAALMAVTGIKAATQSSRAAADRLRRTESAAGRRLLSSSTLGALSLFQYKPSLGTVVDLRNLTVGGK